MKKITLILIVIALVGCVSLQQQYYNAADDVIDLINDGKADELSDITRSPFLLDGEIVILEDRINNEFRALIMLNKYVDRFLYVTRDVDGNILVSGKGTIGLYHTNTGQYSFIAGGTNNTASGHHATRNLSIKFLIFIATIYYHPRYREPRPHPPKWVSYDSIP